MSQAVETYWDRYRKEHVIARLLIIDETYVIPSGKVVYLKDIYITTGELYVEGDVKII